MPIYQYQCASCKLKFTEVLPVADRHIPTTEPCPECGEPTVLKESVCAGFILKGHCWSKDNYSRYLADDPNYKAGRYTKENED